MFTSFPSAMNVEDFYSKHLLPSFLQTREPDSRNRTSFVFVFFQKLPYGMKEAGLYQNITTAAEAYKAVRAYEYACSNSTTSTSNYALLSPILSLFAHCGANRTIRRNTLKYMS
jgi:hypothetical protein